MIPLISRKHLILGIPPNAFSIWTWKLRYSWYSPWTIPELLSKAMLLYALVNGVPSPKLQILTGVLQGSVLGPILFNSWMNDLPTIPDSHKMIMYADDTNATIPGLCHMLSFLFIPWGHWSPQPQNDHASCFCVLKIVCTGHMLYRKVSALHSIIFPTHAGIVVVLEEGWNRLFRCLVWMPSFAWLFV